MFKNRPEVKFAQGGAYQKENGQWYVTVTIDNSSTVERPATLDEIPEVAKAEKPKPVQAVKQAKKGK